MPLCWRRSSLYGAVRRKEKPSRYNWAYSNGSSMASAFNVHNPIREWSLSSSQLPNSQCEAYNQQKYKHQCCSCVDCILQIFLSSYRISLSFNQSSVTKIRNYCGYLNPPSKASRIAVALFQKCPDISKRSIFQRLENWKTKRWKQSMYLQD